MSWLPIQDTVAVTRLGPATETSAAVNGARETASDISPLQGPLAVVLLVLGIIV